MVPLALLVYGAAVVALRAVGPADLDAIATLIGARRGGRAATPAVGQPLHEKVG